MIDKVIETRRSKGLVGTEEDLHKALNNNNDRIQSTSLSTFLEQIRKFGKKSRKLVEKKIELLRLNPYRFKACVLNNFQRFKGVRVTLDGKERRLIYVVIKNIIFLVCIFDRDKGYGDLEKFLEKFKDELGK